MNITAKVPKTATLSTAADAEAHVLNVIRQTYRPLDLHIESCSETQEGFTVTVRILVRPVRIAFQRPATACG